METQADIDRHGDTGRYWQTWRHRQILTDMEIQAWRHRQILTYMET